MVIYFLEVELETMKSRGLHILSGNPSCFSHRSDGVIAIFNKFNTPRFMGMQRDAMRGLLRIGILNRNEDLLKHLRNMAV